MSLELQTAPLCRGWDYQTNSEVANQPCVENRRWTYKKVTYATVNVQGSCNNLCGSGNPDSSGNPAEYDARNAADKQWLQETLDEASAKGSAGVMIIWQADPCFDATGSQGAPVRNPVSLVEMDGKPDGFQDILLRLRSLTIAFKKPVVLVHGDSHYFMVDKPLLAAQGRQVENFTRVETFGDNTFSSQPEWDNNHVHWVKALVDPNSRDVFAFQAQTVPGNRVAVPAP
jgi:hypothetical protein